MRAITGPGLGGADVLRVADVGVPEPGPGQVSVDVAYAGTHHAGALHRRDAPRPFVPGIEVSGHVRAVGPGVEGLRGGRPVAALTVVAGGGYAEVAVASADLVVPLDGPLDGLGLDVAAAVPANGTAAFLVLDRVARIEPGESVLVHAAAGGAGGPLGRAARLLGAGRVAGTVGSPAEIGTARGSGFDEVVLRDDLPGAVSALTRGRGFDIVVDMVGGPALRASLDALAPMGRMVVTGDASGAADAVVPVNELRAANKTVSGFDLAAFAGTFPDETGRALRRAVTAAASGDLRIEVEELPLDRAAEAHRRIESGAVSGALVLAVRR
ncbi:quinone oxidoreductase family protein [Actinomadura chibensis]|uniref:Zinc-binding dehydrogenase n=1 Tax=Actinomadura chibensis TaxID=392828 RepID=A0A5D0N6W8_9ACTN|nr:zinc-binding dehydrogenase [Actinomadura chibensis]TYB40099.1 zinc-binding dehydrogenase [Actinomadura chibensis]